MMVIPRARSSGALSISSYFLNLAPPPSAKTKGGRRTHLSAAVLGGEAGRGPHPWAPHPTRTAPEGGPLPSTPPAEVTESEKQEQGSQAPTQRPLEGETKPPLTKQPPRREGGRPAFPPMQPSRRSSREGKAVSCNSFQPTGHPSSGTCGSTKRLQRPLRWPRLPGPRSLPLAERAPPRRPLQPRLLFVMAAVSVVLPWSTWPMVPTFTWGLSRT